MRISDWSSDVCSSDLAPHRILRASGDPETLRWCRWATDARIVCQVAGREKIGEFVYGFTTLIAVDSVGGNVKTLSKLRGANAIGFDGREIGRASCRERVCQYV